MKEQKTKFELEITERKEELKAQETELADLRNQAKTFEPRLAKGIADAVEKAMKELKLQFDHEKTLTTQQAKSTQSLLEQKIESLEHVLESQKSEIERLNKVATDATNQMTRIAERAVTKTPEPQVQSFQSTS